MASVEAFETLLKDVVQAKRLSASKMSNLTEIAMKSMEYDTQLVSILYRTHKSLQPPAKISSLYIFDALCRAARHQVIKHNTVGDINSSIGNCATFLLKVGGVLEGLFEDMASIGTPESKEKTKKILDIWVKGSTFPSHILSRLTCMLEGEQVSEVQPLTTMPDSSPSVPPSVQPTSSGAGSSVAPAMDPQATLLALLAQAANANIVPAQIIPNTGLGLGAGLDSAQLAVLQQLALAQTANNAAPSQSTPQPPLAQPGSSYSGAFPSHQEPSFNDRRDQQPNRPSSPERVNTYDNHVNSRPSFRGGFRGGFRGRWRGEGRRWDDRDRYQERDDWSPARRPRRSRSRSPSSRFGGRREVRPYSPPRRHAGLRGRRESPEPQNSDKDEFGRDLRPQSPDSDTPTPPKRNSPPPPPPSVTPSEFTTKEKSPVSSMTSNHVPMSLTPSVAANTSPAIASTPLAPNTTSAQVQSGMDNFNPATFDFTSPAAWEALGKMWQTTHGHLPSAEELMQFVVGAQAALVAPAEWLNTTNQGWAGSHRSSGFSNAGGNVNGNTRGHGQWSYNGSDQETDAVVLGGGSSPRPANQTEATSPVPQNRGGQMQKVGDKWMFVRDPS